jgi:hypothetical protein
MQLAALRLGNTGAASLAAAEAEAFAEMERLAREQLEAELEVGALYKC